MWTRVRKYPQILSRPAFRPMENHAGLFPSCFVSALSASILFDAIKACWIGFRSNYGINMRFLKSGRDVIREAILYDSLFERDWKRETLDWFYVPLELFLGVVWTMFEIVIQFESFWLIIFLIIRIIWLTYLYCLFIRFIDAERSTKLHEDFPSISPYINSNVNNLIAFPLSDLQLQMNLIKFREVERYGYGI